MSIDRETQELVMLRILGVLLILVGFSMLARNVRSDASSLMQTAHEYVERIEIRNDHCHRVEHEVRVNVRVPQPPSPPKPPTSL